MGRHTTPGRTALLAGITCLALAATTLPATQAATDPTLHDHAAAVDVLNRAPLTEISGPATGLSGARDIAVDKDGNIYVSHTTGAVRVFAAGSTGNAAPMRTIAGVDTLLTGSYGLAVDDEGWLYVSNHSTDRVLVFAPGANGNVAPTRVITGAASGIDAPYGVELAPDGSVVTVNSGPPARITVHRSTAAGNTPPDRTVEGAATGLESPFALDIAADGSYVVGDLTNKVLTFAPGANGNQTPVRTILGSNADFSSPGGVAVDSDGNLYVASFRAPHNVVLAFGPTGNEPLVRLDGPSTRLTNPVGMHLYARHRLLVADSSPGELLTFAPLIEKQSQPGKVRGLKVMGKARAKTRKIVWKAPKVDGNTAITGYRVVVKRGAKVLASKVVKKRTTTVKRAQLRSGQHTVIVRARNSKGLGKGAIKKFRVRK